MVYAFMGLDHDGQAFWTSSSRGHRRSLSLSPSLSLSLSLSLFMYIYLFISILLSKIGFRQKTVLNIGLDQKQTVLKMHAALENRFQTKNGLEHRFRPKTNCFENRFRPKNPALEAQTWPCDELSACCCSRK